MASLQVGNYPNLKNFRKILRAQRARALGERGLQRELQRISLQQGEQEAASQHAATAAEAARRLRWTEYKQNCLDRVGVMIQDVAVDRWDYGALNAEAQREMSWLEIRWNSEMIQDERLRSPVPAGHTAAL